MNLVDFASRELALIGVKRDSENEVDKAMWNHIITMVHLFVEEEHIGESARWVVTALSKLLLAEPLSPLTGSDDEWEDQSEAAGYPLWQNKRCHRVFKESDRVYDSEGRIFVTANGEHYITDKSDVDITFPYTPVREFVKLDVSPPIGG